MDIINMPVPVISNIPLGVSVNDVSIPLTIQTDSAIPIGFDVVFINAEEYDGAYEVTPKLYSQSLETRNKALRADVQVHEIPVTYTSNLYDGLTVVIG